MLAVSNTSPVSNLALIGRLGLLKQRYRQVRIPPAVATELSKLSHEEALDRINGALKDGWLRVEQLSTALPQLAVPLDPGEHEAIALALAVQADVLLMDEKYGREAARQTGLTVAGVLGELLYAKLRGSIPTVLPEVQKLRSQAGFYISSPIERFILDQAGE